MSNPNPRPLRTIRDLRDNSWMIREGLAEIERDQILNNSASPKRYELSKVPYLGTDGSATLLDLVPRPRKIYEDDSDYVKACKGGGTKNLIWWHPDYPIDVVPEKSRRLLRPKMPEWSLHPDSLLKNPNENFEKNRKLTPIVHQNPIFRELKRSGKVNQIDVSDMPAATGTPRQYSWEPSLKREAYSFQKIISNGYLAPFLHETKKRNYFDSLMERPQTEMEKLEDQIFHQEQEKNRKLREKAQKFDRMTRGKPSWTTIEKTKIRYVLFPNGWGRGVRAPIGDNKKTPKATDGLASQQEDHHFFH